MKRKKILRLLSIIVFFVILIQTAACGTILYPERRGQKHGQMDPAVIVLDGVCLIFFIVPGIVAFAVDFTTGAIYLPRGKKTVDVFQYNTDLIIADIDITKIDKNSIEQIISEKTGKDIDLDAGNYKTFKITDSEFTEKYFVKTSIN